MASLFDGIQFSKNRKIVTLTGSLILKLQMALYTLHDVLEHVDRSDENGTGKLKPSDPVAKKNKSDTNKHFTRSLHHLCGALKPLHGCALQCTCQPPFGMVLPMQSLLALLMQPLVYLVGWHHPARRLNASQAQTCPGSLSGAAIQ